jgi:DNA adenine methylase
LIKAIKPFIRWAGGKQALLSNLLKHLPDMNSINNYYEPFLGAGSLFFGLENVGGCVSDINYQLINAYKCIRDDYEAVFDNCKVYEDAITKDLGFYYKLRREFNLFMCDGGTGQAARFIVLMHSNYNGLYRVNSDGLYNVPVGNKKMCLPDLCHFKSIKDRLRNVDVLHCDYRQTLRSIGKNDLVYLDPPYMPLSRINLTRQYTVKGFDLTDYDYLYAFAQDVNMRGAYVMISSSDNEYVNNLFKGWRIIRLSIRRSISCDKVRKSVDEVIIKNY